MNQQSDEENKLIESTLRTLVALSRADGEIDGSELLYLLDVGRTYGVSDEMVRSILMSPKDTEVMPTNEKDRMTVFYYLLFMMRIDGTIKSEEEDILLHYGFKLGFNELFIREMIRVMRDHLHDRLPTNELLEVITKYLN